MRQERQLRRKKMRRMTPEVQAHIFEPASCGLLVLVKAHPLSEPQILLPTLLVEYVKYGAPVGPG